MKFLAFATVSAVAFSLFTGSFPASAGVGVTKTVEKQPARPRVVRTIKRNIAVEAPEIIEVPAVVLQRKPAKRNKTVEITRESNRRALFPRVLRRRVLGCEAE